MSKKKQKLEQKTVRSYGEAHEIGSNYIKKQTNNKIAPEHSFNLPPQINNPVWEISHQAFDNTLKYVCEYLHHQSYMLCINNNDVLLCKLEMGTTAPIFKRILNDASRNIKNNKQITGEQQKFIQGYMPGWDEDWEEARVMQCVVKPYDDITTGPQHNEYLDLIKGLDLPNGVFLLNLTDAIILRNDGKSPFTMVTGKIDLDPKYKFDKHLPILSISGQRNYLDIPIPNYDDIANFYKPTPNTKTSWADKKIAKAVFRGGPTGCGYTEKTNMRIKLAMMKSPLLDVQLTGRGKTIDSKSVRFDPKYGLGMLNTGIKSSNSFLTMADQSHFKYIIHVDGNVNAYRLLTTMMTGSLILRVTSQYTSWADHMMKHMVHYVPVKADLSDLLGVSEWCKKNDDVCKRIANKGMEFAKSVLNKEYIRNYFKQILWTVASNYIGDKQQIQKLKPKTKVETNTAIITIFRGSARETQRQKFIEQMNQRMAPYKYHIFIIEQSEDGNLFNIGKLKNVGFDIATKYEKENENNEKFTNFIFTDIDMLPNADLLPYYVQPIEHPISLAVRGTRYEQTNITDKSTIFLGGVMGFNREDFDGINGYPNHFWGWGGEDEALKYRLVASNTRHIQVPKVGAVIDLEGKMTIQEKMKNTVKDNEKWEKLFLDTTYWKTNGLNHLDYELLDTTKENETTTQYKVDLQKSHDESHRPQLFRTKGLKFDYKNKSDKQLITNEYDRLWIEVVEPEPVMKLKKKNKVDQNKTQKNKKEQEQEQEPKPNVTLKVKEKRCPKGTQRNKKTGECEPKNEGPVAPPKNESPTPPKNESPTPPKNESPVAQNNKEKRCPKGTQRNKKTGECETKK